MVIAGGTRGFKCRDTHGVAHRLKPQHVQQHAKITAMINGSRQTPATTATTTNAEAGVAWWALSSSMRPVMDADGTAPLCSVHTECCSTVLLKGAAHTWTMIACASQSGRSAGCKRHAISTSCTGLDHLVTSWYGCICGVRKLVKLARASCLDRLWGLALRAMQQLLLNPLVTNFWLCRLQACEVGRG